MALGPENTPSGQGQCSTTFAVTFTTSGIGTVVLAWGGHIASELDWGAGNSATFISGSPYHMVQDDLCLLSDGSCTSLHGIGAQDRALSAGAVIFFPSITTDIKKADGSSLGRQHVLIGDTVYDTASLKNASSNAGGTVTYSLFYNGNCSGTAHLTEDVTVTDFIVPDSSNFTPSTAKVSPPAAGRTITRDVGNAK